ncbi:hypothetical protein BN938_0533 [Mucinivorans hirudinis]|uniref:PcfK-like protein n=1 Tax=Mucinivorans hirudinis TaxID=1433126 RepID=A0A060RA08_9BACT|nr:hypothetical protein BN938_0533 [Mucinivorans hirudinis]
MKATDHFKETIQTYLEQRAEYDDLFAHAYRNPLKNLDDCVTYILNYVKNSGCAGFSDEEIFGQAVHYFDEPDIEIGKPIDCKVVVNRTIELTEQEKAEAREKAIKRAQDEAYAKLTQRTKPTKTTPQQPQASLFDF